MCYTLVKKCYNALKLCKKYAKDTLKFQNFFSKIKGISAQKAFFFNNFSAFLAFPTKNALKQNRVQIFLDLGKSNLADGYF